jgi:hypothetical protein
MGDEMPLVFSAYFGCHVLCHVWCTCVCVCVCGSCFLSCVSIDSVRGVVQESLRLSLAKGTEMVAFESTQSLKHGTMRVWKKIRLIANREHERDQDHPQIVCWLLILPSPKCQMFLIRDLSQPIPHSCLQSCQWDCGYWTLLDLFLSADFMNWRRPIVLGRCEASKKNPLWSPPLPGILMERRIGGLCVYICMYV